MKRIIDKLSGATIGVKFSVGFVLLVFLFATTSIFFANDVPIYTKHDEWRGFPIFKKEAYFEFIRKHPVSKPNFQINALIPFSSTTIDEKNNLAPPGTSNGQFSHLLGTDGYNRDVFAGVIYGSRVVVWVGILSNLLAILVAIFFGSLAGYYSAKGWLLPRLNFWLFMLFEFGLLYFLLVNPYFKQVAHNTYLLVLIFILLNWMMLWLFFRLIKTDKHFIKIPVDFMVTKAIEIIQSIPGLLLLIALAAVLGGMNILKLTLLISFLRWPSLTRLVRGEVIKVKQSSFIESAQSLGLRNHQIVIRHILPNIFKQVMVAFAFGVGSSILMEAALSFLGLGLPPDQVTWGMLLSQARVNPTAWWLAVFPGLLISCMILSCYTLGNAISGQAKLKTSGESII